MRPSVVVVVVKMIAARSLFACMLCVVCFCLLVLIFVWLSVVLVGIVCLSNSVVVRFCCLFVCVFFLLLSVDIPS